MATRSTIFVDGFEYGVYVHWNGHPRDRVPLLHDMLKGLDFDLAAFHATYVEGCKDGWSTLERERKLLPGIRMNDFRRGDHSTERTEYEYDVRHDSVRIRHSSGQVARVAWSDYTKEMLEDLF